MTCDFMPVSICGWRQFIFHTSVRNLRSCAFVTIRILGLTFGLVRFRMVGANDGITADTLCVCVGCGQLTYGAQVCNGCAEAARWHAARAAAVFSQQSRVNGNARAAAERERKRKEFIAAVIIACAAVVTMTAMLWL